MWFTFLKVTSNLKNTFSSRQLRFALDIQNWKKETGTCYPKKKIILISDSAQNTLQIVLMKIFNKNKIRKVAVF